MFFFENMKQTIRFFLLILIFVSLFFLDILLGNIHFTISDFFFFIKFPELNSSFKTIFFQFRLPKALTAVLVGISLSVSGLQMQTIFRNPLAGPYILGISSGAALGVAILVLGIGALGFSSFWGNLNVVLAAWIGAALVLLLILAISTKIKNLATILILGILIGSIISALINILQYFSSETMLKAFVIWTLGSLSGVTISQLQLMIPVIVLGFILAFFSSKILDGLLLGEDYAKTLGINLFKARVLVFSSTSILAGTVTAFCGPIGFIGIVVPHLARMYLGISKHNSLILASALIGSILMLLSDILSNLPNNQILPINSVTSLLGIPIIIWIIFKNKKIIM